MRRRLVWACSKMETYLLMQAATVNRDELERLRKRFMKLDKVCLLSVSIHLLHATEKDLELTMESRRTILALLNARNS